MFIQIQESKKLNPYQFVHTVARESGEPLSNRKVLQAHLVLAKTTLDRLRKVGLNDTDIDFMTASVIMSLKKQGDPCTFNVVAHRLQNLADTPINISTDLQEWITTEIEKYCNG